MLARGVRVFSITDHDSLGAYSAIDGLVPASTRVVVGIELNTTYRDNEVHVLGYRIPLHDAAFNALVERNCLARQRRAELMVERLCAAGYAISIADVRAQAGPDAPLGRPHVAKALIAAGHVCAIDEAFRRFLVRDRPGYVPSLYLTPHQAVEAILAAGGVPVLAHPGRLKEYVLIDELAEVGIVGLEVFYPTHDAGQTAFFREAARRRGLVMTAGADFHDPRYNARGVGMEVEQEDIRPFLDLVT